jgi:hypothetical protein
MRPAARFRSYTTSDGSIHRHLPWIIIFAFGVRMAARWYTGAADFWQNGYTFYFALAQNVAVGNGFSLDGAHRTAFRVPLYPMFLATLTFGQETFLPVLIAQSLVGAGSVLCAALIARELFGGRAVIAAVLAGNLPLLRGARHCAPGNQLVHFSNGPCRGPAVAPAPERGGAERRHEPIGQMSR